MALDRRHSKEEQRLSRDRHQQKQIGGESNDKNKINNRKQYLSVLHQNIQSISNKQIEVDLALKSNGNNIDVLCITEHWLKEDYVKLIQLDQYKLVSYYGRKTSNHGGSCIYVKRSISTKDLNSQDINVERDFEVSMTELINFGYIIVCIYRSPDGNFWIFLKNLELIIQKIQSKKKNLCSVVTGT